MPNYRLPCCIAVSLLTRVKKNLEEQLENFHLKGETPKIPPSVGEAISLIEQMDVRYNNGSMWVFCTASTKSAEKELPDLFSEIQTLVNRLSLAQNKVLKDLIDLEKRTKQWSAICQPDDDFYCPANEKIHDSKSGKQRAKMATASRPENSGITVVLSSGTQCSHEKTKIKTCKDVYLDKARERFYDSFRRKVKTIEQDLR